MGRFHIHDSTFGAGTVVTAPLPPKKAKRELFRPCGDSIVLPAVASFVPRVDFATPLVQMTGSFHPYFAGKLFRDEPEAKVKPYMLIFSADNADIQAALQNGDKVFRLLGTVHLFGLLTAEISFGVLNLSRRQPNLVYMIGTNQTGYLVTVMYKNGLWELDAQEPTAKNQWPAGTKIFFLD